MFSLIEKRNIQILLPKTYHLYRKVTGLFQPPFGGTNTKIFNTATLIATICISVTDLRKGETVI